jgi:hypothetical protein
MDSSRTITSITPTSNGNATKTQLGRQSSRLFQSIENTASSGQDTSDVVEEHKGSPVQQIQRPADVDKMQDQRQGSPVNTRSATAKEEQGKVGAATSASAPTTPPFDSQSYAGYRNSASPQNNKPEEGLNGSNVPGLAPSDAPGSTTGSRRTSGQGEASAADEQHRTTNLSDLASSFDRIAIGSGPKSGAASPASTQAPPLTGSTGQQSALHRAMGRSQLEAQQNAGEGGLTPMFNERFLFDDDELEADDSAFVKKYNLNGDDNSFPVLIHRESHPGMVSRCLHFIAVC